MNKILNFHLVDNLAWFEEAIKLIKSKYQMVSIDTLVDYYEGKIELKNACHITVDDGDQTFYKYIYPILKKHNVPASLYVSPKIFNEGINYWFQEVEGYNTNILKKIIAEEKEIDAEKLNPYSIFNVLKVFDIATIHHFLELYRKKTNTALKPYQNMSIAELKEVDNDGLVTIGGHTMNHPVLHNENDESATFEINNSVKELAELLGHPIKCFSYPNGIPGYDFTEREQNLLRANDIKITFSTEAKNFNSKNEIMSIPRIGVSNNESMLFLKAKLILGAVWDNLKRIKSTGEYKHRREIQKIVNG
ncbi:polysaccharide deacetylase family protein [Pedobacter alpinus]|uniref:Polysaccharide deacetylase family protein n=1 Tax=Pedobacter alpinus TaxID=1590643 RepID=A0ABW5TTS7_9SPHI